MEQSYFPGNIEIPVVNVDRTSSIDSMIDRMEQGVVMFPGGKSAEGPSLTALERVRYHCKQLIAKEEMTNSGVMRRVFIGGQGIENHFAMAMNSCLIAAYELGRKGSSRPNGYALSSGNLLQHNDSKNKNNFRAGKSYKAGIGLSESDFPEVAR